MSASLHIPTLRTERLILEPLAIEHSAGMFALWSQEAVCRYSGEAHDREGRLIPLPARTPADSDRILDFFVARAAEDLGFRWAMLTAADHAFVGAIGFNHLQPRAELAYHLNPDAWGRGLMREAARAALAWAAEGGCREVDAFIEAENAGSLRLATGLGFHKAAEPMRYTLSQT